MDAGTAALAFGIPLAMAGVWCGVLALLAASWRPLAERFPGRERGFGRRYGFASVAIRRGQVFSHYASVATVEVGEEGVGIRLALYFSFRHPPIFIPWSSVQQCEAVPEGVVLRPRGGKHLLLFRGRSGRAVLDRWVRWREGVH